MQRRLDLLSHFLEAFSAIASGGTWLQNIHTINLITFFGFNIVISVRFIYVVLSIFRTPKYACARVTGTKQMRQYQRDEALTTGIDVSSKAGDEDCCRVGTIDSSRGPLPRGCYGCETEAKRHSRIFMLKSRERHRRVACHLNANR
eukprot:scaffold3015_cov76-Skeletonema_dohrnii-CCMP3373.AAC.2